MARKDLVTLLLVLAGSAIGGYGALTNSGPVGWLNALQQRLFGSYYVLLSFAAVLFAVTVAGGLLWDGLRRLFGQPEDGVVKQVMLGPGAPQGHSGTLPPTGAALARHQSKVLLLCGLGGIVLTWIAGPAIYTWNVRRDQQDATAVYAAVDLAQDRLPAPDQTHLALRGIPVTERVVTHRSGSSSSMTEDYQLVPIVGVGWKPTDPIAVVMKQRPSSVLPGPAPQPPGTPVRHPREILLLARREGAIPAPALPEFQKMGLRFQDGAALVVPIPSKDGKPDLPDSSHDFEMMLILCGGLSVVILLVTLAMWASIWIHARKAARQAAARP